MKGEFEMRLKLLYDITGNLWMISVAHARIWCTDMCLD